MTAPTSTGIGDALRHLAAYNATAAARTTVELTRSAGNLWLDAVTRPRTPLANLARGALWWSTMADRREPRWHRDNTITLSTPFAHLRDFTAPADVDDDVVPTLVLPPQAGHSSHVIDFSPRQSQLAVLAAAGLTKLYALEWRAATTATRDVGVTDYLDLIDRSVRRMGGRANLVGDCQGGWLAAIYAALHPERVHTLTLAGAPIDFHAGESVIASSTRAMTGALGLAPTARWCAWAGATCPAVRCSPTSSRSSRSRRCRGSCSSWRTSTTPRTSSATACSRTGSSTPRTSPARSTCGSSSTCSTATS
ncbi:DUF3141 domain-containing protein [Pseudonocardia broussonetiae]|uniref:DUF3141 domain-containing protein n=1 Tax=Pseudonocardia broussonetiae TaxID=2736640 RepID=A0A6M6JMX3_9PSEU|nr:DUF3141 domain-containing protein [Pseudonocardia broussonetiae]